ncbi:MAG: GNAT family N-acetyltransferase, partial [Lachnospiraceae bacterium]
YAFNTLRAKEVYSVIRDNNYASQRVAERNGMTAKGKFTKRYYGMDMPHILYSAENKVQEKTFGEETAYDTPDA